MAAKGAVLLAITLLLSAGSASATFIPVGDPFESNSWGQTWTESSPVDHLQFLMVPGPRTLPGGSVTTDAFETVPVGTGGINGFMDYDTETPVGSWSQTYDDGSLLMAHGSPLEIGSVLQFNLEFAGGARNSLSFNMQAYNVSTLVENVRWTWIPAPGGGPLTGNWNLGISTWEPAPPPGTPEPISMVMLGSLGVGMVAARRLKRKAVS